MASAGEVQEGSTYRDPFGVDSRQTRPEGAESSAPRSVVGMRGADSPNVVADLEV